jgi:hypothetical protein
LSPARPETQAVTLWTTGLMVAAPLGLMVGAPLIELAGTTGGLVLSGGLTLLLVPIAAFAVLPRSNLPRAIRQRRTATVVVETADQTDQESRSTVTEPDITIHATFLQTTNQRSHQ